MEFEKGIDEKVAEEVIRRKSSRAHTEDCPVVGLQRGARADGERKFFGSVG